MMWCVERAFVQGFCAMQGCTLGPGCTDVRVAFLMSQVFFFPQQGEGTLKRNTKLQLDHEGGESEDAGFEGRRRSRTIGSLQASMRGDSFLVRSLCLFLCNIRAAVAFLLSSPLLPSLTGLVISADPPFQAQGVSTTPAQLTMANPPAEAAPTRSQNPTPRGSAPSQSDGESSFDKLPAREKAYVLSGAHICSLFQVGDIARTYRRFPF